MVFELNNKYYAGEGLLRVSNSAKHELGSKQFFMIYFTLNLVGNFVTNIINNYFLAEQD